MTDDTAHDPDTGPDYRFTLANERTYLAYVRTALAMLVAGAALLHLDDLLGTTGQTRGLGMVLMVVGVGITAAGYVRWRSNDARIRAGKGLALSWIPLLVTIGVAGLGTVAILFAF